MTTLSIIGCELNTETHASEWQTWTTFASQLTRGGRRCSQSSGLNLHDMETEPIRRWDWMYIRIKDVMEAETAGWHRVQAPSLETCERQELDRRRPLNEIKPAGGNGRSPETCNTLRLLKTQDLTTLKVKLMLNSSSRRSKALWETGYVHIRKMILTFKSLQRLVKKEKTTSRQRLEIIYLVCIAYNINNNNSRIRDRNSTQTLRTGRKAKFQFCPCRKICQGIPWSAKGFWAHALALLCGTQWMRYLS